jgi:hypothetical protein
MWPQGNKMNIARAYRIVHYRQFRRERRMQEADETVDLGSQCVEKSPLVAGHADRSVICNLCGNVIVETKSQV